MSQNIAELKQEFAAKLAAAESMQTLEEIRVDFLGKKGSVTELLKSMKDLSPEEKKTFGNLWKKRIFRVKNQTHGVPCSKILKIIKKKLKILKKSC